MLLPHPPPKPAPARIWGFVASEAPRTVLLRRGPSKWTQMWLWNTETDEFEAGSWFTGRIDYTRCDLSPDGKHFIYVSANDSQKRQERVIEKYGVHSLSEWTTLCKPPHFKSCGTWDFGHLSNGGHFENSRTLVLNRHPDGKIIIPPTQDIEAVYIKHPFYFIALAVAMQRTGWTGFAMEFQDTCALEKGSLHLAWDGYPSFTAPRKLNYTYPGADLSGVSWADLDPQGCLVYARQGCVYRHTDAGEQHLADLNASQPHRPWLDTTPQHKEKTAPKGDFL